MPTVPDIHRRGTRAQQSVIAAPPLTVGTLYFVTDEGVTERWSGATWESYSGAGGGGGTGKVVQVVNTQTGALATGTTSIPIDNTIPQQTEGDQYMTLAVTPTLPTNKLKIDVVFNGAPAAAAWIIVALFQDTTANALAAMTNYSSTNGGSCVTTFTHYMTAGATSPTTFKVRAAAVGTTLSFNGGSGNPFLGGTIASSITITEIVP